MLIDTATAEIAVSREMSARARIVAFFELTKPRIAVMLVFTSAAGFYLASTARFDFILFANTVVGITLLAFGVATLNQFLERQIDAVMSRTARRPLPTGRVTPNEALIFGILQCAVAELYLFFLVNALTAILGLIVIAGYVFLYTPLKTRTSASTAIGAVPGAMPPLLGWTAAANDITLGGWALFALIFIWQFPHFLAIAWMYRDEYAAAGVKMLSVVEPSGRLTAFQMVVFALMLGPVSLAPYFLGFSGIIYLSAASLLWLWFAAECIQTARRLTTASAKRMLLVSVLYLPILFAVMVLDR